MRRIATFLSLAAAFVVSTATAQTQTKPSTESAVWEVHLNVQQLFASPLGEVINEVIHKEAPDGKLNVDAFIEAIGFDPRTNVTQIVAYGDDFEKPSVTAIVDLGSSRGNIEGWLLAAPGYTSEKIEGGTVLHSFKVEDDEMPRIWCALPKKTSGTGYFLVAGFNAAKVQTLIEQQSNDQKVSTLLEDNGLLSVRVNDLSKAPIEIDEDDPGSGIIKTLQSVSLSATNLQDKLLITGEITTDDAERAEQLNQLIVGMKAMVQLALPKKDPDSEKLAKLLNNVNVEYATGATSLSTRFEIGYDELLTAIEMKHKQK